MPLLGRYKVVCRPGQNMIYCEAEGKQGLASYVRKDNEAGPWHTVAYCWCVIRFS